MAAHDALEVSVSQSEILTDHVRHASRCRRCTRQEWIALERLQRRELLRPPASVSVRAVGARPTPVGSGAEQRVAPCGQCYRLVSVYQHCISSNTSRTRQSSSSADWAGRPARPALSTEMTSRPPTSGHPVRDPPGRKWLEKRDECGCECQRLSSRVHRVVEARRVRGSFER